MAPPAMSALGENAARGQLTVLGKKWERACQE